ncbi:dihydrolipoamide acetyltransferase [Ktedonobacteria bacterium brp13]|nr:dihydrolipoamide acetyltransferase [Ktedonobacteria bacterium brp13]
MKKTVIVNGQLVHYYCTGQGEAVILIHGLCGSSLWWDRNVATIAEHYQVYMIDLPGFGNMRHARKQFTIHNCSAYIHAWMQAIGLAAAHLVGHSMGGYICMTLALQHPEQVRSLVLIDTIGIPLHRSVIQMLWPLVKDAVRTAPTFWPILCYDALRAGPITLWRAAQEIVALDATTTITSIKTSLLLLWGKNDNLVPLTSGEKIHTMIEGASLVILPKANHISMYEEAQTFNEELLSFLRKA